MRTIAQTHYFVLLRSVGTMPELGPMPLHVAARDRGREALALPRQALDAVWRELSDPEEAPKLRADQDVTHHPCRVVQYEVADVSDSPSRPKTR